MNGVGAFQVSPPLRRGGQRGSDCAPADVFKPNVNRLERVVGRTPFQKPPLVPDSIPDGVRCHSLLALMRTVV